MAVKKILLYPDPLLLRISERIETFDENLVSLAKDLMDTMYDADGVGFRNPDAFKVVGCFSFQVGSEFIEIDIRDKVLGDVKLNCRVLCVKLTGKAIVRQSSLLILSKSSTGLSTNSVLE